MKIKKYEKLGYISIDHNIESFGANILVMHNIFLFQYLSDSRKFGKKYKQLLNPIFLFRILREWYSVNLGRARVLLSVSTASMIEVNAINKKNKACLVVENGVDLCKFKPISNVEVDELKNELDCADKYVILFVGHEFVRKRLDLAFETLKKLDDNYVLWVVGGRSENFDSFKALANINNLSRRVFFLGSIDAPEKIMASADAFILLSDYETWGMVAVEALATGTPCVMTNVGCAPSVIESGLNGYIVNNPAEAANAILKLNLNSQKLDYTSICRNSVEKYSWENVAEKYMDVILELDKK